MKVRSKREVPRTTLANIQVGQVFKCGGSTWLLKVGTISGEGAIYLDTCLAAALRDEVEVHHVRDVVEMIIE